MVHHPAAVPRAAAIAVSVSLVGISANAQQILLLDFWCPSCGPCMQMKPIVHALADGVTRSSGRYDAILKHRASSTSIRFLVS